MAAAVASGGKDGGRVREVGGFEQVTSQWTPWQRVRKERRAAVARGDSQESLRGYSSSWWCFPTSLVQTAGMKV